MMIHALELLENEIAWMHENGAKWDNIELGSPTFWMMLMAAAAQTGAVTITPYATAMYVAGVAEDYAWVRTAPQWKIKKFVSGPGGKGIRAIGWSTSRRSMVKLGIAKVGSRFIPYVGWALLAYDAYSVAKWAKGKI